MTAARGQAVQAGARALANEGVDMAAGMACDGLAWVVIDAAEFVIRADEASKWTGLLDDVTVECAAANQRLTDLRAKVEGLRDEALNRGIMRLPHHDADTLDAVLAMFDEEKKS